MGGGHRNGWNQLEQAGKATGLFSDGLVLPGQLWLTGLTWRKVSGSILGSGKTNKDSGTRQLGSPFAGDLGELRFCCCDKGRLGKSEVVMVSLVISSLALLGRGEENEKN